MAKRSLNRREFLKISALSSGALALGGCASLDRLFTGDQRNLENEVLILGAGAAGLAAAYTLKKNKIPFRVFEGSSRIGGRVHTVQMFSDEGPVAELGAEFFEDTHRTIFALAKEFNLATKEIKTAPGFEPQMFYFNGRTYRVKDFLPKMKTLSATLRRVRADLFRDQDVILTYRNALQYERSSYYDSLSLKDLLDSWSTEVDPLVLDLIASQAVARFGVDASEQSALHFLSTLDAEGSTLLTGRGTYRLEGGLTNLMQVMSARAAGVIPEHILKMNHVLTEISEEKGVFELTFKTPKGKEIYQTKNVICTLPFTKLREVHGINKLNFSEIKQQAIASQSYATHSKGVLSFASPFWRKQQGKVPANLGNFSGDFLTQKMWDSGRAQPGDQGLLTISRAGTSGRDAGFAAATEAMRDLGHFYESVPAKLQGDQMINWSQRPFAMGSMAYFKKGQYTRFRGAAVEPEYAGHFLFAGEHASLRFAGTLNGALESGIHAASSISV
ncbi:MAG: FAD-dependent oxidoreductase [Bacillota bacterium]